MGSDHSLTDRGAAPDAVPLAPAGASTYDLIAESASLHRDWVAVVDADRSWTYGELMARVDDIATAIAAERLPPSSRIGLVLARTADAVASVLAVWKCGMTYVPIDLATPPARANALLRSGKARLVLVDGATDATRLDAARCLDLRSMGPAAHDRQLADEAELRRARAGNEVAYVIYTSGTTGKPKGVMIEHRSVINLARAHRERIYRGFERSDRGLRASLGASLAFDGAVERMLLLHSGHSLFVLGDAERTDPQRFISHAAAHDLEVLDVTPAFLGVLIRHGLLTHDRWAPSLVLVGGEAISAELWRELAECGIAFFNVYGPTETTVNASVARITDGTPNLGHALANTRLYVLNEDGSRAADGDQGEIHVSGVGVGRGYDAMPEETAARFKEDPFSDGDPRYRRMYATGDRGRLRSDGTLEFLGRTDAQIKLRGFRIEPAEITSLLCAQARVDDALVRLRRRDGEDQSLVAYVVSSASEHDELSAELTAHLREQLPGYMVPNRIVVMDRFPLTTTGKLDEEGLASLSVLRVADAEPDRAIGEGVTPALVAIWKEVLNVDVIGPSTSFFELGGHSLSAVAMIARVNESFDVNLPVTTVFIAPTITSFDRAVRDACGASGSAD